jgi:hypothetical protein
MADYYYVDADGGQAGPVGEAELVSLFKANAVNEETLCWNESMAGWEAIGTQSALYAKCKPPAVSSGPPMPPPSRGGPPPPPNARNAPAAPTAPKPRKRLEKKGDAEAKAVSTVLFCSDL